MTTTPNRQKERIQRLVQILQERDKIHLQEAAVHLNVSAMTLRRDLQAGLAPLLLLGGYVVLDNKNSAISHYQISVQHMQRAQEKKQIARLAVPLIKEQETLFFDCGTTIPYIIQAIPNERHFTAICYSLNAFLALQEKPNCRAILCGGEFHASNTVFTPLGQQCELSLLRPSLAFISAAGVCLQQGVTCFNLNELMIKHLALQYAQTRVLVVDNSKFDQVRPAAIAPLQQFDQVITDSAPPTHYRDFLADHQIILRYP
ncbi:MAG: DNA-binding transcriptional repressor DeoR [Enterobacteriaceae bacterium]